jgi:pentatricopeptide repeat protein
MSSTAGLLQKLFITVVVLGASSGSASANDDQGDDWRDKALALNDVTGDDPIKGEIQNWTKKPSEAKQLLSTATSIAKEKNQPLNYNAAYILAKLALNLKDYKSGQTFFQLCAEQAFRLRSGQKLVQAYLGLADVIDGLTGKKDYDRAAKVCQEFLETLEREHAGDGLKNDLMRRLVRALAKQGKTDEAWRIMDNMLKVRGNDWRNLELKAWLQQETNRTAELAHTYEELQEQISKDGELEKDQKVELIADVRRQLIRALVKQGKADEAWRTMNSLLKERGSDWRNVELKGWVQQETNHTADAAKTYEGLLKLIPKDESLGKDEKAELVADVHYILSGVYVEMDKIDTAAEHLQLLLKQHPDEPKYNNDLGYIWADHDMHLDEAERMIRKALDEDRKQRQGTGKVDPENDKDNAAYLDSMGWVLFKKKKYEEAKPYLERAIQDKDGQQVEIFDHLAEVCKALGQTEEAVAAWKKATEATATTRREKEKKAEITKKLAAMR